MGSFRCSDQSLDSCFQILFCPVVCRSRVHGHADDQNAFLCRIRRPLICRPLATALQTVHDQMAHRIRTGERGLSTDIKVSALTLSWNRSSIERASVLEASLGHFAFQSVCQRAPLCLNCDHNFTGPTLLSRRGLTPPGPTLLSPGGTRTHHPDSTYQMA